MMSSYQKDLLNHLKPISHWVAERGGAASLRLPNLVLRVQCCNRAFDFQPQFERLKPNGETTLALSFTSDVHSFAGWLPYCNKQWPAARQKLAFKAFAGNGGIRTPGTSTTTGDLEAFLIKKEGASFGEGIRGPYRRASMECQATLLEPDEYCEAFIPGKVLQALYWNGVPVCVELSEMASITGDGVRTIGAILCDPGKTEPPRKGALDMANRMLALNKLTLDSIPAPGESVPIDCRHAAPSLQSTRRNRNCIDALSAALKNQLNLLGMKLVEAIPEAIRENTVFSIDGIVDDAENLWCLEMNCNPHIHPDIYPAILESLFAEDEAFAEGHKPPHLQDRFMPPPAIGQNS
jgi:hypothetical protein